MFHKIYIYTFMFTIYFQNYTAVRFDMMMKIIIIIKRMKSQTYRRDIIFLFIIIIDLIFGMHIVHVRHADQARITTTIMIIIST